MSKIDSGKLLSEPKFSCYRDILDKHTKMDIINKDLNFYNINELTSAYIKSESYISVKKRGMKVVKKILSSKNNTDSIAIIAHGSLINETVCGFLQIREMNWNHMLTSTFNCYVIVTEYNNKRFSLLSSPTNFFLDPTEKTIYDKCKISAT